MNLLLFYCEFREEIMKCIFTFCEFLKFEWKRIEMVVSLWAYCFTGGIFSLIFIKNCQIHKFTFVWTFDRPFTIISSAYFFILANLTKSKDEFWIILQLILLETIKKSSFKLYTYFLASIKVDNVGFKKSMGWVLIELTFTYIAFEYAAKEKIM